MSLIVVRTGLSRITPTKLILRISRSMAQRRPESFSASSVAIPCAHPMDCKVLGEHASDFSGLRARSRCARPGRCIRSCSCASRSYVDKGDYRQTSGRAPPEQIRVGSRWPGTTRGSSVPTPSTCPPPCSGPGTLPLSNSVFFSHSSSVCGTQPIFSAVEIRPPIATGDRTRDPAPSVPPARGLRRKLVRRLAHTGSAS